VVLTGDRLFAAWRENSALHQRIADLEIESARLRAAGAENRRLREALGLPELHGLPLRPVEVLALGGDPAPTSATLSAGSRDGVRAGDALLTSEGLVGRVVEVWPRLSRAQLLTDPNMAVACEVETTGVNGILRWSYAPRPRLLLTAIPLADTIRVGEFVATSELSLRFPRGIPVGRVARIQVDASGLMQEVEVTPAAQLSRLRHAFVAPGPVAPDGGDLPRPRTDLEPGAAHRPAPARPGGEGTPRPARPHAGADGVPRPGR